MPNFSYVRVPANIHLDPELNPRDTQVMSEICMQIDDEDVCSVSPSEVAKNLRIDRATVDRSIKRMIKAGWLVKLDRKNGVYVFQVLFKNISCKHLEGEV